MSLQVNCIRLHPNAQLPKYSTEEAGGLDLTAISVTLRSIYNGGMCIAKKFIYGTGVCIEIPVGYVGLLFPRSSIHKTGMDLTNCVGMIDSDYQGEIQMVFRMRNNGEECYNVGDKIGQLLVVPRTEVQICEVDKFTRITARGTSGFGSTGK